MTVPDDLVAIGEIVSTQGIRGDLRVVSLSDFPERFRELKRVFVGHEDSWQEMHVRSVRFHGRFVIIGLREVSDMNAAEALRRSFIAVPRAERWALPEGYYYVSDLIGLTVEDERGRQLGSVKDVFETGSNSVLVVGGGDQEILVPMLKTVIRQVDPSSGKILVQLPPGLVEEPDDAH